MTLDMTTGFDFVKSFLVDITIFNIEWIISLVVIFIILILISRDANDWKILALPVTIVTHIMGLTPSFIWYIIATIMFAVELFSTRIIGGLLQVFDKKPRQKSIEEQLFTRQYKKDTMNSIRQLGTKEWFNYMQFKNKKRK